MAMSSNGIKKEQIFLTFYTSIVVETDCLMDF